jgi:hypothetical protein
MRWFIQKALPKLQRFFEFKKGFGSQSFGFAKASLFGSSRNLATTHTVFGKLCQTASHGLLTSGGTSILSYRQSRKAPSPALAG